MAKASENKKRLLRALVVEDDPGMRQLIVGIMELDGWDVREARDGDEAVTIAGDWRPDAVVIDVVMPGKDGLTALREIRQMDGGAEVGVLVVAATPVLEHEARAAGSDAFMVAPLDGAELSARVRAAHRWRRPADEHEPAGTSADDRGRTHRWVSGPRRSPGTGRRRPTLALGVAPEHPAIGAARFHGRADREGARWWTRVGIRDATGGHELRYWDGANWTEHVSDGGVAATAPVQAAAPSATPATPFAAPAAMPFAGGAPMAASPVVAPAAPKQDKLRLWTFLVLGGGAAMLLGALLPWAQQNSGFTSTTISGTSTGGGSVSLVLGLAIAAIAGFHLAGNLGRKAFIATLVLGSLGFLVAIANFNDVSSLIEEEEASGVQDLGIGTSVGGGLVVLVFATILVIVASIFAFRAAPAKQPAPQPAPI